MIFWKGGVDYGSVAYRLLVKKGGYPILGGKGRFWEGRRCLKWGYIMCGRVDSVSVAFWEGGVDYVSVAYSGSERGNFWRDG